MRKTMMMTTKGTVRCKLLDRVQEYVWSKANAKLLDTLLKRF